MTKLFFPFTLRLYAHTLHRLGDHNFTGMDLFYRIKDCWKGREEPTDLLVRPLEPGLSLKIAKWCFDTLFDVEGHSESAEKPYIDTLQPEDLIWFVEEVCQAARLSSYFSDDGLLETMETQIKAVEALFNTDEDQYWTQITGPARHSLRDAFTRFCGDLAQPLSQMKQLYSYEIADRILHDRELCHFIARTLLDIGFDGETIEGLRSQWVNRERWPARIKEILIARDRGKCAMCGTDIVQELRDKLHIDHMFSISRGGCNDLVNLQLLCSSCNLTKHTDETPVASSVPQYIRRPKLPKH